MACTWGKTVHTQELMSTEHFVAATYAVNIYTKHIQTGRPLVILQVVVYATMLQITIV